ncbi:Arc family DNA-binding protein [Xenorhabdus sp. 18]|uniref:Arc family DNA-binding protein n=1 Tax=Xenorhabdus doucetiae TaxID=351671 RepID=UPI0019B51D62|nr:Arc family DNA-binding protein [Xenorhabdus sp. 18]MBD2797244.1 Arc family DNA-binding protein [Xenorhabdus sp. 18]
MSKYPSQEMDRFNIRMPVGMRDAIAKRAETNGRSMNSEIVSILDNALRPPTFDIDKVRLKEWEKVFPYMMIETPKDMAEFLRALAVHISSKG